MNFKKIRKPAVLILVPPAFALLGYLLIYLCLHSVISPVINIWSIMATDNHIEDHELDSIYTDDMFYSYTDTIPSSKIKFPTYGTKYGEVFIEGTTLRCDLYFGDSYKILRHGAGQYLGSSFPGLGSTVLIGGHNNRYFDSLKDIKKDDIITVKTNYGIYTYKVTHTAIKRYDDASAYDLGATTENIVLYTCYPFTALNLTPERYFVYGEYISGPKILIHE